MASEKIINQKKEEVANLAEKMKDAKLILLTDYRGISVEDVTNLRADLRKTNSEYKVIKNNITRRELERECIENIKKLIKENELKKACNKDCNCIERLKGRKIEEEISFESIKYQFVSVQKEIEERKNAKDCLK